MLARALQKFWVRHCLNSLKPVIFLHGLVFTYFSTGMATGAYISGFFLKKSYIASLSQAPIPGSTK